jgi:hypothetical protein
LEPLKEPFRTAQHAKYNHIKKFISEEYKTLKPGEIEPTPKKPIYSSFLSNMILNFNLWIYDQPTKDELSEYYDELTRKIFHNFMKLIHPNFKQLKSNDILYHGLYHKQTQPQPNQTQQEQTEKYNDDIRKYHDEQIKTNPIYKMDYEKNRQKIKDEKQEEPQQTQEQQKEPKKISDMSGKQIARIRQEKEYNEIQKIYLQKQREEHKKKMRTDLLYRTEKEEERQEIKDEKEFLNNLLIDCVSEDLNEEQEEIYNKIKDFINDDYITIETAKFELLSDKHKKKYSTSLKSLLLSYNYWIYGHPIYNSLGERTGFIKPRELNLKVLNRFMSDIHNNFKILNATNLSIIFNGLYKKPTADRMEARKIRNENLKRQAVENDE